MQQKVKILMGIGLFMFLVLFTAYAEDLNSQLWSAAKQGDTSSVEALLAKGAI